MTAAVIIAIIGTLVSLFGVAAQVANNAEVTRQQERARQETQQYNHLEAILADERQREMYNALYSPSAKVNQYKQAGLSTSLMYGGSGMGGQMQAHQASTSPLGAPVLNPIIPSDMMDSITKAFSAGSEASKNKGQEEFWKKQGDQMDQNIKNMEQQRENAIQQLENLKTEREKIEAETNTELLRQQNLALQNISMDLDNQYKERTMDARVELMKQNVEKVKKETEETIEKIRGMKIENDNKQKMIDLAYKEGLARIKEINSQTSLNRQKEVTEQITQRLGAKTIDEIDAKINLMVEQKELTKEKAKEIKEKVELYVKQEKLLEEQTKGQALKNEYQAKENAWFEVDRVEKYTMDAANAAANILKVLP